MLLPSRALLQFVPREAGIAAGVHFSFAAQGFGHALVGVVRYRRQSGQKVGGEGCPFRFGEGSGVVFELLQPRYARRLVVRWGVASDQATQPRRPVDLGAGSAALPGARGGPRCPQRGRGCCGRTGGEPPAVPLVASSRRATKALFGTERSLRSPTVNPAAHGCAEKANARRGRSSRSKSAPRRSTQSGFCALSFFRLTLPVGQSAKFDPFNPPHSRCGSARRREESCL